MSATPSRAHRTTLAAAVAALAMAVSAPASPCPRCARFDFLCCDVPSDHRFYLTSFTGEGMACGGYADGRWYYSTSWVRWHCGAKLQVTNPTTGACVVVEVADAGPAAWVEERAGMPILDASTVVCRDLFGSSSCGWSDRFLVEVVQVDDATPTGADGCGPRSEPPQGWVDSVECAGADGWVRGWAQDPDDGGAGIRVHLYFDGPAGSGAWGTSIAADQYRDDLCGALGSCDHGFAFQLPVSFRDGERHTVHAYGIDIEGVRNAELSGSPYAFTCEPPPMPLGPPEGVLRHVTSPESLDAWGIAWNQIAPIDDAVLGEYLVTAPLPAAPRLLGADGDPARYLDDHNVRRHVIDPESLAAWHLAGTDVERIALAELEAMLLGPPMPARPFAAQGSGPEVWIVDYRPALWAELVGAEVPEEVEAGGSALVVLELRNEGSIAWEAGQVQLAPVAPRDTPSPLCDGETWTTCDRVTTITETVEPGRVVELAFVVRGPADGVGTTVEQCWNLVAHDTYWFSDEVQGGPADDEICLSIAVVEEGEVPDPDDPDAGPDPDSPPDAGEEDGGGPAPRRGIDGQSATLSGGCSCSQPTAPQGEGALLLFVLLAAWLAFRRPTAR